MRTRFEEILKDAWGTTPNALMGNLGLSAIVKTITLCLLLASSTTASTSFAQADECNGLPDFITNGTPYFSAEGCQCGKRLRNLKLSTPPGLKLMSACALRWGIEQKAIDLNNGGVSFDQPNDGDSILGVLFLSGKVELSGHVEIYPTLASYKFAFYPKWSLSTKNSSERYGLYSPIFIPAEYATDFHVQNDLNTTECYVADAKVRIEGLQVIMSEQDDNGTWALAPKVLQVSKWKKCKSN